MKTTTIVGVAVVVLIAAGGWWYVASQPPPSPGISDISAPETSATPTQVQTQQPTADVATSVFYTNSGFSPATVTVAKGGTVTFVNQSGGQMWVASGPHPAHTGYSDTTRSQHCPDTAGTAFDECTAVAAGQSYSFTFQKTGTWGYHNHVNASDFGTVIVQ